MPPHHEPTLTLSEEADTSGEGPIKNRVLRLNTLPRRAFWASVSYAQRSWPVKQSRWEPFGKTPKSWWPDFFSAAGFLAITVLLLWQSWLVDLDREVRVFLDEHRVKWLDWVAWALNQLGSGRVVAPLILLLALWCAVRYKSIRPLIMYTVAYLPLGIIFLMKHGLGRMLSHPGAKIGVVEAAPEKLELFSFIGAATAYPSGHAANTIVWFGLAVLIIGGALRPWMRWFLLIGPPVIVGFTQTYMGLHWLTDAPAGYLLGILIIRSVRRVPWDTVSLGPLKRFEPASPEIILSCTVAVGGLLLCATKYQPAIIAGVIIFIIGSIWAFMVLRQRR